MSNRNTSRVHPSNNGSSSKQIETTSGQDPSNQSTNLPTTEQPSKSTAKNTSNMTTVPCPHCKHPIPAEVVDLEERRRIRCCRFLCRIFGCGRIVACYDCMKCCYDMSQVITNKNMKNIQQSIFYFVGSESNMPKLS